MSEEDISQAGTVTGEAAESVPQEEQTPASTEEAEASTDSAEGGTPEGEEAETEEKSRAQERIQQEIAKRKQVEERLSRIEAQLQAKLQAEAPPPDIDVERLNGWLAQTREQIEDMRLEGRHLEADLLEDQRRTVLAEFKAHQQKAQQYQSEQAKRQQEEAQYVARLQSLDQAAELYRQEMKIPEEVWNKGAEQWHSILAQNPLLDRQYWDIWNRQGDVAAIKFAHDHMTKVQAEEAKKLQEAKAKKDAGKVNITGAGEAPSGIKTWDQLMGLGSKQVEAYRKNNPKHYQQLLDAQLK